jgi:hypothetical protein
MRLGDHPKQIVTTTPKPIPLIVALANKRLGRIHVTHGSSYENLNNLAPTFQQQILQYEGTDLGKQEIYAEILDLEGRGVIKRKWLKMWPALKEDGRPFGMPDLEHVIISLDTAFTEDARVKDKLHEDHGKADYTACTVWGYFTSAKTLEGAMIPGKGGETEGFILLDAWMERMGMPDLLTRVKRMWEKMRYGVEEHEPDILPVSGPKTAKDAGRAPDLILIEEKGSGISLRQMLEREQVLTWPYNPGRAKKIERLHAVSHLPHAGRIWIPEGIRRDKVTDERIATGKFASWAEPMIGQVCAFYGEGSTEYDDYVDSTSQAWRYLADWGRIEITVPRRLIEKDYAAEREALSWYGE